MTSVGLLAELTACSATLHACYLAASDMDRPELADAIHQAGVTVAKAIGLLVVAECKAAQVRT